MKALVTGAAGFIGSNLVEALLRGGWSVRGLDCFTSYYARADKEANLEAAREHFACEFLEGDLLEVDVASIIDDVDVVFHVSAQAGVRRSWRGFEHYVRHNVLATQRLLEAARETTLLRFVYSSSSSVYGNAACYPTSESDPTRPHSPYGVTKLAGEQLCRAYADNWDVPTVSLRYFTVFGPRQRPDMAIHKLIESGLTGDPFPLYGDGEQVRDFTYVEDAVRANLLAADASVQPGSVYNVGGGSSISMNALIEEISELLGCAIPLERDDRQPGDVRRTGAAIRRAEEELGWSPETGREEGLKRQIQWHISRRRIADARRPRWKTAESHAGL